ncbi:hypothetical protein GCM10023196_053880 [Actinoallomurus vinaceus]|uniref:Uncharacterized protein n=1 Tax=Actinoallomurus vinaceus TaxID=1080074 RepID=A0ABP8UHH4_9ACTN
MSRPQEQIVNPHTLAVPADSHDATTTPAWQAARTIRHLAESGDVAAAHRHINGLVPAGVDPLVVLRNLAEQLANPPAPVN